MDGLPPLADSLRHPLCGWSHTLNPGMRLKSPSQLMTFESAETGDLQYHADSWMTRMATDIPLSSREAGLLTGVKSPYPPTAGG